MNPKYSALFTSVNLLLGAGPLILPQPFFKAGILLSTIWVVIIILISYNSAIFIAQAMSKIYYIEYQKSISSMISGETITDQRGKTPLYEVDEQQSHQLESIDHNQQLRILYGNKMKVACSIAISIYLLGTAISKCIMTAKTLSKVFSGFIVVGTIQFWLLTFFVAGALFSFKSIQKTSLLQTIIIFVRTISIALMLGGSLFLIISQGVKNLVPSNGGIANFGNFTQIFSNSVFALMFHHSFPSIASQVKNSADLRFFLRWAFLISGSILILIPISGIMAFGDDLGRGSGQSQSDLKYYNFDFEGKINFIYYFVSFYVFLNIAAIPVYVIVIRANILKLIFPLLDSKRISKHTIISTALILTTIILVALVAQNQIQIVLDFTGGIFGIVILFIIPSLEVYMARKKTAKKGEPRNNLWWLPFATIALGIGFLIFNLYQIIYKMIK